jgi:hypothetical protein
MSRRVAAAGIDEKQWIDIDVDPAHANSYRPEVQKVKLTGSLVAHLAESLGM